MKVTRLLAAVLAAYWALNGTPAVAHDDAPPHETHRIAIQVSDDSPGTFNKGLNNALNM